MKLTSKQERFAYNIAIGGMTQHDAYMDAYNTENMLPATIDYAACELAKNSKITNRIAELREKTESDGILSVRERKEILSTIALEDNISATGVKVRSPAIRAIAELNKMDGVYSVGKTFNQDKAINIIVSDKAQAELLAALAERTGKLLPETT